MFCILLQSTVWATTALYMPRIFTQQWRTSVVRPGVDIECSSERTVPPHTKQCTLLTDNEETLSSCHVLSNIMFFFFFVSFGSKLPTINKSSITHFINKQANSIMLFCHSLIHASMPAYSALFHDVAFEIEYVFIITTSLKALGQKRKKRGTNI